MNEIPFGIIVMKIKYHQFGVEQDRGGTWRLVSSGLNFSLSCTDIEGSLIDCFILPSDLKAEN